MLKAQMAGGAALSRYGGEEGTARRAPTEQAGSLRYQDPGWKPALQKTENKLLEARHDN